MALAACNSTTPKVRPKRCCKWHRKWRLEARLNDAVDGASKAPRSRPEGAAVARLNGAAVAPLMRPNDARRCCLTAPGEAS